MEGLFVQFYKHFLAQLYRQTNQSNTKIIIQKEEEVQLKKCHQLDLVLFIQQIFFRYTHEYLSVLSVLQNADSLTYFRLDPPSSLKSWLSSHL